MAYIPVIEVKLLKTLAFEILAFIQEGSELLGDKNIFSYDAGGYNQSANLSEFS